MRITMTEWQIFFNELYEFERGEAIAFEVSGEVHSNHVEARLSERVKAYDKLIMKRLMA